MNLSLGMQQAFAYRKINPLSNQLFYILFRSTEAVQNPRLLCLVFFSQGDDFIMAPHIVQDHWLLQGFRKLDLPLKEFNLLLKTGLVHLVQTRFAEGKYIRIL